MTAVIQRVSEASVSVAGELRGRCREGVLVLLGVSRDDTPFDIEILASKTAALRIFPDENGKMNRSLLDIGGEALVVSQFTLCADTRKGNRPSFAFAMEPELAEEYYERFCEELRNRGVRRVETGVFGADMQVSLVNNGPVTILLHSERYRK